MQNTPHPVTPDTVLADTPADNTPTGDTDPTDTTVGWENAQAAIAETGLRPTTKGAQTIRSMFAADAPPLRMDLRDPRRPDRPIIIAVPEDDRFEVDYLGTLPFVAYRFDDANRIADTTIPLVVVDNIPDLLDAPDSHVGVMVEDKGWLKPEAFLALPLDRPVVFVCEEVDPNAEAVIDGLPATCGVMYAPSVDALDAASAVKPGNREQSLGAGLVLDREAATITKLGSISANGTKRPDEVKTNWVIDEWAEVEVRDIKLKDAISKRVRYVIGHVAFDGQRRQHEIEVPNEHAQSPAEWMKFLPGSLAAGGIGMGMSQRDATHILPPQTAILPQLRENTWAHYGWVENSDGDPMYVLGSTAFDAGGPVSGVRTIDVSEKMNGVWGVHPEWVDPTVAITEAWEALEPLRPIYRAIVFAAILRAILPCEDPRTNMSFMGESGHGKSTLGWIVQSAFIQLPPYEAPFPATASKAALDTACHALRNVVVVIDDVPPDEVGSKRGKDTSAERSKTALADFKRAVYNRQSDSRSFNNGDLRPFRRKALVAATTEEEGLGASQSVDNRNLVVSLQKRSATSLIRPEFDVDEAGEATGTHLDAVVSWVSDGGLRRLVSSLLPLLAANSVSMTARWRQTMNDIRSEGVLADKKFVDRQKEALAELIGAVMMTGELVNTAEPVLPVDELVAGIIEAFEPHAIQVSSTESSSRSDRIKWLIGALRGGDVHVERGGKGSPYPNPNTVLPSHISISPHVFNRCVGWRLPEAATAAVPLGPSIGEAFKEGIRLNLVALERHLNFTKSQIRDMENGLASYLESRGMPVHAMRHTRVEVGGRVTRPGKDVVLLPWELVLEGEMDMPTSDSGPRPSDDDGPSDAHLEAWAAGRGT